MGPIYDKPRTWAVHWEDDCLAHVLRDSAGAAVDAFGNAAEAEGEARDRGAGWTVQTLCVFELPEPERWRIGGCSACQAGPCSFALMPGEACSHGCGCHGYGDADQL